MSTAALMHDHQPDPVPHQSDIREPSLVPGFHVRCNEFSNRWLFTAQRDATPHRREVGVMVYGTNKEYWRSNITPAYITLYEGMPVNAPTDLVRALADLLAMAANFADALNADLEEQLRRQEEAAQKARAENERLRQERIAAQQKAREEAAERVKVVHDAVKWHVGDKFRLKRMDRYGSPMKATVFGTIDDIADTYMRTTSEKGKRMRLEYDRMIKLEIRDDDNPRKFNAIYERPQEPPK